MQATVTALEAGSGNLPAQLASDAREKADKGATPVKEVLNTAPSCCWSLIKRCARDTELNE